MSLCYASRSALAFAGLALAAVYAVNEPASVLLSIGSRKLTRTIPRSCRSSSRSCCSQRGSGWSVRIEREENA